MKRCPAALVIREMQIRSTISHLLGWLREKGENYKCWRGCGESGTLIYTLLVGKRNVSASLDGVSDRMVLGHALMPAARQAGKVNSTVFHDGSWATRLKSEEPKPQEDGSLAKWPGKNDK